MVEFKNIDVNNLLNTLQKKKHFIKKLKNQVLHLNDLSDNNYKSLDSTISNRKPCNNIRSDNVVMFIVYIIFSRTNTLFHVTDSSGKSIFFCSSGSLKSVGSNKKARFDSVKHFHQIMLTRLSFLRNKPISLHLKNVGQSKFWIIKKLKRKFFVKLVHSINNYPHNGCRKKKLKRK